MVAFIVEITRGVERGIVNIAEFQAVVPALFRVDNRGGERRSIFHRTRKLLAVGGFRKRHAFVHAVRNIIIGYGAFAVEFRGNIRICFVIADVIDIRRFVRARKRHENRRARPAGNRLIGVAERQRHGYPLALRQGVQALAVFYRRDVFIRFERRTDFFARR